MATMQSSKSGYPFGRRHRPAIAQNVHHCGATFQVLGSGKDLMSQLAKISIQANLTLKVRDHWPTVTLLDFGGKVRFRQPGSGVAQAVSSFHLPKEGPEHGSLTGQNPPGGDVTQAEEHVEFHDLRICPRFPHGYP
jgi:hypothetical protein